MRRRNKTGGKAAKTQRRKTLSRRNAPKSARNRRSSAARQETEVAGLTRELHESREQQAATSEVLGVISSSPGELGPVFEAILENATRICGGRLANLFLYSKHEHAFRLAAQRNAPAAYAERWAKNPVLRIGENPRNPLARLAKTKRVVAIPDLTVEPGYINREPRFVALVESAGARTHVLIPMLKEGELIGGIAVYRQEVLPFTDRQIELLRNFAAQAVIAVENTRLLNELRESLEQQTATSEVLRVISSSPGELEPVFQAMLQNARRICEAEFGVLNLCEGEALRAVAMHGAPQAFVEERRRNPLIRPPPQTALGRVVATKQPVQIADIVNEPHYFDVPSGYSAVVLTKLSGARTVLAVPMLKENELIGAIVIYRTEVRPFSDKQIELVKNFAAQAVIAIENARLLNDLNKLNQQLEQRVADQVSEIERMGRLRRFLPPQVADLIVASGTEKQLESHRREITALFCDLRGFTGFSESSDPEDVIALLREYHAAIGEIINKYGGTLERYAGDGVMVVFNDPIPVDNPALQAALMAIDMRTAIGTLIEKWRKLGHDIGFGIGIAHGFATLGTIGFEGRFDYAAIGTVSNVASRLCDEAKPGQILISPRVLMAVDKDITVEPVGDFALKGIRRPLTAYNVLDTKVAD
jgi:class 3 adenylate cyclase